MLGRNGVMETYLNRERSWLLFNRRVLAEAEREDNPLFERLRFLAITAQNLDEFFMVRVAGLRRQVDAGIHTHSPDGLSPEEALEMIASLTQAQYAQQSEAYRTVMAALQPFVHLSKLEELSAHERAELARYYRDNIQPVLTPLAVDPSHPFPFVSNLSLNLAVSLNRDGERRFARVKVPLGVLPRLIPTSSNSANSGSFVLLEDLMRAHIDELFSGVDVLEAHPFRVTRDADLEVDEEDAEDLLELIERSLRRRRFGEVMRLEVNSEMPTDLSEELRDYLDVPPRDVYRVETPLGLGDLAQLTELDVGPETPRLLFPGFTPGNVEALAPGINPFTVIHSHDVLLHHPYQSFEPIVELLRTAANDPNVLAIKQTLYRTGGDRNLLEALLKAVESGKQVVALVELKARFDEERNIVWARSLEQAGIHVVYGVPNLKTHAKITLIIRREAGGLCRYVHLSTGNYNPRTARLYTDIGLLTSDEAIGNDASRLFNALTGYSEAEFESLIVAPQDLRGQLLELINREAEHAQAGRPARLIAKLNSLTDTEVIDTLYAASNKGLEIDLIVRGICCLRPGVPGLSERIRVRSIIGRFLEHSRIISLENGGERKLFISSADWMTRNLSHRVELLIPVHEPGATYLHDVVLAYALTDTFGAWSLQPNGEYKRIKPKGSAKLFSSQLALAQLHGNQPHGPPDS